MIELLLLLTSSMTTNMQFRGTYTANIPVSDVEMSNETSYFYIDISNHSLDSDLRGVQAQAAIGNTSRIEFPGPRATFYGFPFLEPKGYFFIYIFPPPTQAKETSFALLGQAMKETNTSALELHKKCNSLLIATYSAAKIYSLYINITESDNEDGPFKTQTVINGTMFMPLGFTVNVSAVQFNVAAFNQEGHRFGVIACFGILASFYAWFSLSKLATTYTSQKGLSIHTIILNIGNDFAYALFLLDISQLSSKFSVLFTFLFMSQMFIYFGIQMKELTAVWKSHNENFDDMDLPEVRTVFIKFFAEVGLVLFVSSVMMTQVFTLPFVSLTYLTSAFIPQIIHSTKTQSKKHSDTLYVILVSLSRILPIAYFTFYENNIQGTYSILIGSVYASWIFLQALVIILQNQFGGAFFLPSEMKPEVFNYRLFTPEYGSECAICLVTIEEGDDAIVTPCHHSFHRECIARWMEERPICPICRSSLPPLEEETV